MNIIYCIFLSSLIGFSVADGKGKNNGHHSEFVGAFGKLRGDVYRADEAVRHVLRKTDGVTEKAFYDEHTWESRHKRDNESVEEDSSLMIAVGALNLVTRTLAKSVYNLGLAVDGLEYLTEKDLANDTHATEQQPDTQAGISCSSIEDCLLSNEIELASFITKFTDQLDNSVQDLNGELNDLLHPHDDITSSEPDHAVKSTRTSASHSIEGSNDSLTRWLNILSVRVTSLTESSKVLANSIEDLEPLIPNLKPCEDKPCDPDHNSKMLEMVAQSLVGTTTTLTASADELNDVVELVIDLAKGRT